MAPIDDQTKTALADMVAEAQALSDAELLEEWTSAGQRLHELQPDEFREKYETTMSKFADAPKLEATVPNWARLGARLIRDRKFRGLVAKLTVYTHLELDRVEAERAEASAN